MTFGLKTNERPGTRATVKYVRMSASKVREVLETIRGVDVAEADAVLQFSPRDSAIVVRKLLASAVANAENNDGQDPETLYVATCYADEGTTIKRWRPRARGRATRIRKRTCHITIIVSAYAPEELERRRSRDEARVASGGAVRGRSASASRAARVARSRKGAAPAGDAVVDEDETTETTEITDDAVTPAEAAVDEAIGAEDEPTEAEAEVEVEAEAEAETEEAGAAAGEEE